MKIKLLLMILLLSGLGLTNVLIAENAQESRTYELSLSEMLTIQVAMAQEQNPDPEPDPDPEPGDESCPGGSCSLYRIDGTLKCTACCPANKNPSCADLGGCSCS